LKSRDSNLHAYSHSVIDRLTYRFTTEKGNEYLCYFLSYAEYFYKYPRVALKIFAFNLELITAPDLASSLYDPRIAVTVAGIIHHFLASKIHCVVYVCDARDNRESTRAHKFDKWFEKHNNGNIVHVKGVIHAGGINLINAMLIHKDNKLKDEFIAAFLDLNNTSEK
jgi:Family of unknown function (DUF6169)